MSRGPERSAAEWFVVHEHHTWMASRTPWRVSNDCQKKDCKLDDSIRAFDIVDNLQKLGDMTVPEVTSGRTHFGCFDGIRFILTIVVISFHAPMYGQLTQIKVLAVTHFPAGMQKLMKEGPTLLFANPQTILSFFMVTSSILLAYTGLRKGVLKENFLEYVARRWARYIPTYIGCVCIFLLWQFTGNGPLYHEDNLSGQTGSCYNHWWRPLLLIQNLFDMRDQVSLSFFLSIYSLIYSYLLSNPLSFVVHPTSLVHRL